MKKANTIPNFNNDTVTMFGHNQKLLFTISGHYCIPVGHHKMAIEKFSSEEVFQKPSITLVVKDLSQKSAKEKQEIVRKLHRQFSHCSSDKLKHVIVSSGISDPDILSLVDSISDTCQTRKVYKKPHPKPIVGLLLASQFNHTVAMDLKSYANGVSILHLIDTFTRYSAACVVKSKDKDVIVEAIFKIWISYFNNDIYRDMCKNINVVIGSTAAESPCKWVM